MSVRSITLAVASACFLAAGVPVLADHHSSKSIKPVKTDKGMVLGDAKGMTLYIFDKDQPGQSNCYDKCAQAWPPLKATADAHAEGDFSVVKRKDGIHQWAYKGMPLYTWFKDKKAGDATGDGVKGVWHVIAY